MRLAVGVLRLPDGLCLRPSAFLTLRCVWRVISLAVGVWRSPDVDCDWLFFASVQQCSWSCWATRTPPRWSTCSPAGSLQASASSSSPWASSRCAPVRLSRGRNQAACRVDTLAFPPLPPHPPPPPPTNLCNMWFRRTNFQRISFVPKKKTLSIKGQSTSAHPPLPAL